MARPRGDDVKRGVSLATFELIAAKGVDGMSMRALSELTQLSTGTINYHFGSKHGVLLAAIEYGYKQRPHDWNVNDPILNLATLLRRYELTNQSRTVWWQFWLAIASCAQSNAEIAAILVEQHRWVVDRFRFVLEQGSSRGLFDLSDSASVVATTIVNVAHGHAISQLVGGVDPAIAAAELASAVSSLTSIESISLLQ